MSKTIIIPSTFLQDLQNYWGIKVSDLVLYVTSQCNLRCSHCYIGNDLLSSGTVYDLGSLISLISSTIKLDRLTILGGEPLLNPDISMILGATKSIVCDEKRITTNLTSIPTLLSGIESWAGFRVCVSVDGFKRELHDGIRGSGTFTKTTQNIVHLIRMGLDVEVMHVVTKKIFNIFQI
jgi:molybdenum cofactor biosynthesis enzyme MoaA